MKRPKGAVAVARRERRIKKKLERRRQRRPPEICYRRRLLSCRTLGFDSYDQYLKSKLWAEVRERVLARDSRRCRCCNRPAAQVHHSSYDTDTLAGRDLRWLAAVCSGCHLAIEFFPDGKKRSVREVGEQYRIMRRSFKSKVYGGITLEADPEDQLSAEFFAIVRA